MESPGKQPEMFCMTLYHTYHHCVSVVFWSSGGARFAVPAERHRNSPLRPASFAEGNDRDSFLWGPD